MTTILKHRELKTARRHLMPPQQHLYNGLARPADYNFCTGMYLPVRLSWLANGQRADVVTGQTLVSGTSGRTR